MSRLYKDDAKLGNSTDLVLRVWFSYWQWSRKGGNLRGGGRAGLMYATCVMLFFIFCRERGENGAAAYNCLAV